MAKPLAGPSFLGTFGLVFVAIAALFAVDMFLARLERKETHIEATHLFEQGRVLLQHGENAEAIERIKDALAIQRGNRDYQRTLARAQLAVGRTAAAESTLNEFLQSDSTDGPANLIMGRVLAKQDRFAEAISYYRRAIDGDWDTDASGNRLQVRFELIDLLAQRDSKEELLAELLPAQQQAPGDLKTQDRLGRLFLLAGSPAHAADVFRGILHDLPSNAEAHAGLGEAEFARGNYRTAERDFVAAWRLAPGDQAVRQRLELCSELLGLDPVARGLAPPERFQRSRRLMELTLDETTHCAGQTPSPKLQGLFDQAGKALKAHVSAARESEVAESNLDLAEQLWQTRRKECKPPPAPDSALALVMARLAQ